LQSIVQHLLVVSDDSRLLAVPLRQFGVVILTVELSHAAKLADSDLRE